MDVDPSDMRGKMYTSKSLLVLPLIGWESGMSVFFFNLQAQNLLSLN